MKIQELLQKHTNSEGVVDYVAVDRDIQLANETEINTKVQSSVNEFKADMEQLKQRNGELETLNKSLTENETYLKSNIAELTTKNGEFKRKSDLIDFRERAEQANVDPRIVQNFIDMEGVDLSQVDLVAFSGKPDPQGNNNQQQPIANGGNNGYENLFDFMDEE